VTTSHTDQQKVERAFAAELLAPAKGVEHFILDEYGTLHVDDVDAIAEHFRVSPMLIADQIENQLELEGGSGFY
jgi:Zn-dependent peptidase ImmA (M78 family)